MGRRMGQLLTLVVLATSGTYLLVYLYRWEWNRALVAGTFFIAAEVAIIGTTLLRRLQGLEQRLDHLQRPGSPAADGPAAATLARLQLAAPAPRSPFAWLEDAAGRTNVFVPVLLGAGVILSLLAHAVERVAGATTRPALERHLAERMAPLTIPAGGLLTRSDSAIPAVDRAVSREPNRAGRAVGYAFAAVVMAFGMVVAIDVIADATQNRPDPPVSDRATEVTIDIAHRDANRSTTKTAEALWVACRSTVGGDTRATELRHLGRGTVRLIVEPALGEHAQRRFVGCLEDATFDRVAGRVQSVYHIPSGG